MINKVNKKLQIQKNKNIIKINSNYINKIIFNNFS